MTLRKPVAVNKLEKPVIIFKNNLELKEFPSIQSAAKWLKDYSSYKYMPYRQIENGIFFEKTWLFNGDTYTFTTDENVRLVKLKSIGEDASIVESITTTNSRYKVGSEYSRKDIYKTLNVPENKQDGIWNTSYTTYDNDIYIFVNINSAGTTGHDYDNKFIGDNLQWFSKNNHSLNTPSIQAMLNPKGNIFIFTREDNSNPYFIYQGNGKVLEFSDTKPVKIIWTFNDENENYPNKTTGEVENPEKYTEGATKQVSVNIYERNPVARKKCIEHFGYNCVVCDFNFKTTYGDLGKDFIHVHHLKELHTIGKKYEVDPIADLRPVCPNCHAMLHKRKPAYSIEEIKTLL